MNTKSKLTIPNLIEEAQLFCVSQSNFQHKELYGVTDGKAVGTLIEQKFQAHLKAKYEIVIGSSAKGIDLPSEDILTDIQVISIKQSQSSYPYKDAKQKIFGLGYNLLVFIYDKTDDPMTQTSMLNFVNCSFVSKERTADYNTTYHLRKMVNHKANEEDIMGYLQDHYFSTDKTTLSNLAMQILKSPPEQGCLTISKVFQWSFSTVFPTDMGLSNMTFR